MVLGMSCLFEVGAYGIRLWAWRHILERTLFLRDVCFPLLCVDGAKDDIHLFETAALRLGDQTARNEVVVS